MADAVLRRELPPAEADQGKVRPEQCVCESAEYRVGCVAGPLGGICNVFGVFVIALCSSFSIMTGVADKFLEYDSFRVLLLGGAHKGRSGAVAVELSKHIMTCSFVTMMVLLNNGHSFDTWVHP